MANPVTDWGNPDPYYSCANCHRKANDLQLCPQCKTTRYCNDDCLTGNRAYHEKWCYSAGKLPWGETPVPSLTGPIDPGHPSNPLHLRSQPVLSPERLKSLRSYDGPPPPEGHTWGHAKLTAELNTRPDKELQFRAAEWFEAPEERKDSLLCDEKSIKELALLLREWVYERITSAEEAKALNIALQTWMFKQNVDTLEPDDTPKSQKAKIELTPAMEMVQAEMDARIEDDVRKKWEGSGDVKGMARFKLKLKRAVRSLGRGKHEEESDEEQEPAAAGAEAAPFPGGVQWMLDVPQYFMSRYHQQTHYGTWLHKSLLKKLPADHDCSRFEGARQTPDNEIIATLLQLGVPGIDEGSFWELEDTVDNVVLQALNQEKLTEQGKEAKAKMQRTIKRYGAEDKVKLPSDEKYEKLGKEMQEKGNDENVIIQKE